MAGLFFHEKMETNPATSELMKSSAVGKTVQSVPIIQFVGWSGNEVSLGLFPGDLLKVRSSHFDPTNTETEVGGYGPVS